MNYRYCTVDVFTSEPFNGAQLTVFPEAAGLDERQMQRLANEMNHTETVFVCPPPSAGFAAALRVFSPRGERDFGSHTTVAAAFTLAQCGMLEVPADGRPVRFVQNQRQLEVHLQRGDGARLLTRLSLRVEPTIDRFVPELDELTRILGLDDDDVERIKAQPRFVSCGTPYLLVPVRSLAAVYRARFSAEHWAQSSASSVPVQEVVLVSRECEDTRADFHLRLIGPDIGAREDPPVGAAVPSFAAWLGDVQSLPPGTHSAYIERGTVRTRKSLIKVEFDIRKSSPLVVRVGGDAVMVGEGQIQAP